MAAVGYRFDAGKVVRGNLTLVVPASGLDLLPIVRDAYGPELGRFRWPINSGETNSRQVPSQATFTLTSRRTHCCPPCTPTGQQRQALSGGELLLLACPGVCGGPCGCGCGSSAVAPLLNTRAEVQREAEPARTTTEQEVEPVSDESGASHHTNSSGPYVGLPVAAPASACTAVA